MNKLIGLFFLMGLSFSEIKAQQLLEGATVEGQKQYKLLGVKNEAYMQKISALNKQVAKYKTENKKDLYKQAKEKLKQLEFERSENVYAKAVRETSDSALKLYAMNLYAALNLTDRPKKVEDLFNTLSPSMQQLEVFDKMRRLIGVYKALQVGEPAPLFSQADTSGQNLSLTSFRGRYVLIDFWASWCKPCRAQNPMLVSIFEKYKHKQFTILGVSLDSNKKNWLDAIQQDKLTWYHVSDLQSWKNAVAQLYNINSVPKNFLVDPDGIIIGRNLEEEELVLMLKKI